MSKPGNDGLTAVTPCCKNRLTYQELVYNSRNATLSHGEAAMLILAGVQSCGSTPLRLKSTPLNLQRGGSQDTPVRCEGLMGMFIV